jgi:ATP-dependent Clp protease ATP-binding subunit ClpA
VTDLQRSGAERDYVREAESLLRGSPPKLSAPTASLLDHAQAEARARDDNHVGTEHLMLGLYALGESTARRVLESLGINRQVFAEQLEPEEGTSPSGQIPLTPRAHMIMGLAGIEAAGTPSGLVEPEHVLLGVIRESEKWEAAAYLGPHHLRAAAVAAGAKLVDVEHNLIREMKRTQDSSAYDSRE